MTSLKSNEIPEFRERRICLHSLRAGSIHNEAQIIPECAFPTGTFPPRSDRLCPHDYTDSYDVSSTWDEDIFASAWQYYHHLNQ